MLGGRVGGNLWRTDKPGDTRGDDDAAVVWNERQRCLNRVESTHHMDIQDSGKSLRWVVRDFPDGTADTCITDQHIDVSALRHNCGNNCVDLRTVSDVCLVLYVPRSTQVLGDAVCRSLVQIHYVDNRPFAVEEIRGCKSNPAYSTGD